MSEKTHTEDKTRDETGAKGVLTAADIRARWRPRAVPTKEAIAEAAAELAAVQASK